ncbi:MAG: exodeoxyribonuclease VII large subunit [Roseiflexaceae bacterium]|nr:exodeoxyribonuclease VII large subunit [Roseiflexaceae bacterium]
MQLLTVSQLNMYLRDLLDADDLLRDVWVEGEISNFSRHFSGHCYFTLKEGDAQIGAVMWKSVASRLTALPVNGEAVLAHGRVAFYEVRGQVQLYVDMLRPAGIGLLQAQFERLKERLAAEGLFDPSRKRPLPPLPHRIGIVTLPTGAVLQDMLNILRRRYPLAEVVFAPCRVQGAGAADTIIDALYALYKTDVDVIIVARGGGAAEDLWTFNDEQVARAVFASPVPVVSGVGHETDTTIIDFVADVRAPTPSAAAELVSPDIAQLSDDIAQLRTRLETAIAQRLAGAREAVARLKLRLDLRSPESRIRRDRQQIDDLMRRATAMLERRLTLARAHLDGARGRLAALSPLATLARGYAVVQSPTGALITDASQVSPDDHIEVIVRRGRFRARVEPSASGDGLSTQSASIPRQ